MRKIHLFQLLLLIVLASCDGFTEEVGLPEPADLTDFETIVSFDELVLASPERLRFNPLTGLFVYDSGLEKVVRLSQDGEIVQEIGRTGNGPGEYQSISNIYLLDDSIFLVDDRQFNIHKFSQKGRYSSSFVYGNFATHRINKPSVVNQEEMLLPGSVADQASFRLINRKGEEMAKIGQVPEGSVDELDYDVFRADIANREIPSYLKPHVFAVNGGDDTVFIVYEAFPTIRSYDLSGNLRWETGPVSVPEIDSIATAYYSFMEIILKQANAILPLRKYVDGVSKDGRLFVSTSTSDDNPLWIHEFSEAGRLKNRFLINSDVGLKPHFDVDIVDRKLFVLTDEGDVRAYSF